MIYLFIYLILIGLVAYWAHTWNRNPGNWILISILFSPLISAIALGILGQNNDSETHKTICPFCKEKIRFEAIICKHCGSNLSTYRNAENLNEKQLNELIEKIQGKK